MKFMFYFFCMVGLVAGIYVILAESPISSVLFLVLTFCCFGGMFLLIGAEFFAILLLLVYVGAIAILFLFVVIMLDVSKTSSQKAAQRFSLFKVSFIFFFLFSINFFFLERLNLNLINGFFYIFNSQPFTNWLFVYDNMHSILLVGSLLYTTFVCYFLLAGFVLLIAMLCTIALCLPSVPTNKNIFPKKQQVQYQLSRVKKNAIFLIKTLY